MTAKGIKKWINNVNRVLIAALSVLGFVWDGLHVTDLFFSASLVLWVWQAEWVALECRLLALYRRH